MRWVKINGRIFDVRNQINGVLLYDGEVLIAFLKDGSVKENPFFVTATQTSEGIRYMFSTCTSTDQILGLDKLSYSETVELAEQVLNQVRT